MAAPNVKLAESLELLRKAQDNGRHVFQSADLPRVHRERLVASGFLRNIVKGWYMVSKPQEDDGNSTAWYASFFEFVAAYCNIRFGVAWYLSPELSLQLHAGSTAIPRQVQVHAKAGQNNNLALKFNTALFDYQAKDFAPTGDVVVHNGLRLLAPTAALVRAAPTFYIQQPLDVQIVLAQIRDASDLLARLLDGGQSVVAGRIAGALRAVGREDDANRIVKTMRASSYVVNEQNPFAKPPAILVSSRGESPCSLRIRALWDNMREHVVAAFPPAPGVPADQAAYLQDVNDRHIEDAYHSLSIEGYKVSTALIAKIAVGAWNPEVNPHDTNDRNAMAAKGYHQAFLQVRSSVQNILQQQADPGAVVRHDHHDWYLRLFEPSVRAGIIEAKQLAGYRSWPVYIRNARHVPPAHESVRDAMPTFFDLLTRETEPAVRAVLGHFIFVYIHPYMDGNGRMARFLMNAMLASGGYPWTVIHVADRAEYMAALDEASAAGNIQPFAHFVGRCVAAQMTAGVTPPH